MPHQHKAGWETDEKGDNKGGYMGLKRNKAQM
jgi:hypothetical protein